MSLVCLIHFGSPITYSRSSRWGEHIRIAQGASKICTYLEPITRNSDFFGWSGKCVWQKLCSLFQMPLYVMFQQNFFLLSHAISSSPLLLFSSHTKPRYYTNSFIPYFHTFVHAIPTLHSIFSSLPLLHSILSLSFVNYLFS